MASFVESLPPTLPRFNELHATIQLYEASEGVSAALGRTNPERWCAGEMECFFIHWLSEHAMWR
jgi:hypothetical protein